MSDEPSNPLRPVLEEPPALEELPVLEEPALSLFLGITDAAILFVPDGRVFATNSAAEQLFGVSEGAVRGQLFDRIIPCPREYAGNVPRYVADFCEANSEPFSHPVVALCGTQTRLSLLVRRTSLMLGAVACSLLFFQDISELVESQRLLQQKVTNSAGLSAAKSRFLSHLAGNMPRPLAVLRGVLRQQLDGESNSPQLHQELALGWQALGELQKLHSEISDFSQLESNHFEFQLACFNARFVIDGLLEHFQEQANRYNLEFATLVAPSVPEFLIGDPDRLQQILRCLLAESFRSTTEGGVTIRAQCLAETDTHATIEFEISDTGQGLSDRVRKDYQALLENPRTSFADQLGELGVGIAIANELIGRMGGRLTLRSTENVGTTYAVSLKFEQGERLQNEVRQLTGRRALFVNDVLSDRAWMTDICKVERMQCEWVGTCEHAVKRLCQESATLTPFDFVVIDLHGLKTEGALLIEEIHSREELKSTAIVMLVDANEGITPVVASSMRVNVLLAKPVGKNLMLQALRAALVQRRQAQPMLVTQHLLNAGELRAQRSLLVDDNEVNQIIAKGALRRLGITADVTNNGEEAIDAVRDNQYDFILMDCEMPIMDGFEATRLIRAWEQKCGRHTTIIALTANSSDEIYRQCLQAGMDDFMQKPFRADQLQAILDRIARQRIEASQGIGG
ncbi:Sensor histidine kinase [gamma proteobacterium HdN1]|nr:Sensor histidine kinase [gamma proteobacterium HdN1]